MSVGTFAFLVDIEHLRAVFGSNDQALLNAIEARFAGRIREYEDSFAGGKPWLREALADLVAGKTSHPDRPEFYAWATELLCGHLGTELASDDEVSWLDDLELETGLESSGSPLPVPRHADTPLVGYLDSRAVTAQYARIKDPDLAHEEYDSIREARERVRLWLKEAAEAGLGLVTVTN